MALFENYEGRMPQLQPVLEKYGFKDFDEVKAYTHFIAALGKMSRDLKRISATEKEVDNEKYAFRCFLLRLGFIGNEYKAERTILLKNLSGNSSWKNGAPEKEVAACE